MSWSATAARTMLAAVAGLVSLEANAADDPLAELSANTVVKIETWIDVFLQDAAPGSESRKISPRAMLSAETYFNLSQSLRVEIAGYAAANYPNSFQGAFAAPDVERERTPYVDVTKANLSWHTSDFDLSIGKSDFAAGLARIYSVTDRFGRVDIGDPLHPIETGVWQAKLQVPFESDTLTAAIQPFDSAVGIPSTASRWLPADASFFSQIARLEADFRDSELETWDIILKFDGARAGYDFFLLAHHGLGTFPVVRMTGVSGLPPVPQFVRTRPRAWSAAGGINILMEPHNLYAEVLVQIAEDGEDENFVRRVFGIALAAPDLTAELGWDRLELTLEYDWDTSFGEQDKPGFVAPSNEAHPFPNSILAELKAAPRHDTTITLAGTVNLDHGDYSVGLEVEYRVMDDFAVAASGLFLGGPSDTQLGRWRENDVISLHAKRTF